MRRPVHLLALLLLVPFHSVWAMPVIRAPDPTAVDSPSLGQPLRGGIGLMQESASFTAIRDATCDLYSPVLGGGPASRPGASELLPTVPGMPSGDPVLQPGLMSTTADFVSDEPLLVTIIIIDPNQPPAPPHRPPRVPRPAAPTSSAPTTR